MSGKARLTAAAAVETFARRFEACGGMSVRRWKVQTGLGRWLNETVSGILKVFPSIFRRKDFALRVYTPAVLHTVSASISKRQVDEAFYKLEVEDTEVDVSAHIRAACFRSPVVSQFSQMAFAFSLKRFLSIGT